MVVDGCLVQADLPREDRGLNALAADLSKRFKCGGFVKKCRNNAWTRQQKCLDKALQTLG